MGLPLFCNFFPDPFSSIARSLDSILFLYNFLCVHHILPAPA